MIPISCNAVGDILALATLVLDVAHALKETNGSPAEYRAFNSELQSLHIVLASVGRVAELTTDTLLRDEIVREVDHCGKDVSSALEKVAKFSALGHDTVSDDDLRVRMKRQWYKIEWRFRWHGSAEVIRGELSAATQRLTAYLVISNIDGIQNLGDSITSEFDVMTARICMLVMEQFATVAVRDTALVHTVRGNAAALGELRIALRRIPPKLSASHTFAVNGLDSNKAAAVALLCLAIFSSRATSSLVDFALLLAAFSILMHGIVRDGGMMVSDVQYTRSNSVTLHDAMGRRLVLPLELCETRELFHATLVNLFSRTDGSWFVDAHRYELILKRGGHRIDSWDIRSDTEVEMAVIMQYATEWHTYVIQCPVCLVGEARNPSVPTCICSGCRRELQTYAGPSHGLETPAVDAQRLPRSIEYYANDLGRFPRARSTSMSSTSSVHPGPQDVQQLAIRDPLSDPDNRGGLRLNWRHQAQVFTRFYVSQPVYLPIFVLPSGYEGRLGLHLAAENGHYALVSEILRVGAGVDVSIAPGYTALHFASLNGHIRVVELLLDYGAAVDAATETGITPLACAVYRNYHEITALLVARGSMVDASEPMRAAVLYVAAYANNLDVVQMLLRHILDANVLVGGQTALHIAVRYGHRDVVEMLLRNGADANVRSTETGDTPLSSAAFFRKVDIFALLCTASPSLSEEDIGCLLYNAVQGGSCTIIATILQHAQVDFACSGRVGR